MKNKLFCSIVLLQFVCLVHNAPAQTALPDSRKGSEKAYIYTITQENLRKIHLKNEAPGEEMLGQQIGLYGREEEVPELPRGNYLIVTAEENCLNFRSHTVDDFYFNTIPDEKVMLFLYDLTGKTIDDATVKCGSKTLRYDSQSQTYNTKDIKDKQVLEVNNKGVYHYIEMLKRWPYYQGQKKNLFQTVWKKIKGIGTTTQQDKYAGFVVFSKPKYKPGETVKLKAYMVERGGKPYERPVDFCLRGSHFAKVDTVLAKLSPYRPGMYEWQFHLSDSLGLTLDENYTVSLKTGKENDNEVTGFFRYEDYELEGINFSVTKEKDLYLKTDTVKVKLKVTDENEMPVFGGRVEVSLSSWRVESYQNKLEHFFVPDTLWAETVDMSNLSEKELILPNSIFLPDAMMDYWLDCTYISADNEKMDKRITLYRDVNDHVIDYVFDKGTLTIWELYKGEPKETSASIVLTGSGQAIVLEDSVRLPYSLTLPWQATSVTVKTAHAEKRSPLGTAELGRDKELDYTFYRHNDSVFLQVDNPARIPFWYTIRKKDKTIAHGHATQLDYSVKGSDKDAYGMQLSYLYAGGRKNREGSLPVIEKDMTLEVSTPTSVYPGQKAEVQLFVTDRKGKPVDDVDITAYAFTSKFKTHHMPVFAIGERIIRPQKFANKNYGHDESGINRKVAMNWQQWRNTMALDTIAYYNFLYPEESFSYREPTSDGTTQLSPFVMIDGVPQGVHLLWIDDRLYYTPQAQQLDAYSFRLAPGRHTLRFRTYDREIRVDNVVVKEGMKNIVSFNAGKPSLRIEGEDKDSPLLLTSRVLDKKEHGYLNSYEARLLASQLITVVDNFDYPAFPNMTHTVGMPAYINSGNRLYYLNHQPKRHYEQPRAWQRQEPNQAVLVGPFPARNYMEGLTDVASVYADNRFLTHTTIEGGSQYTFFNDFQRIKSWQTYPVKRQLNDFRQEPRLKEQAVTAEEIDRRFIEQTATILANASGAADRKLPPDEKIGSSRMNLRLGKDTNGDKIRPSLILFLPEKPEERTFYRLFYGSTSNFRDLPVGRTQVCLVFNDSTTYTKTIDLRRGGTHHLFLDSIEYERNKYLAATAFKLLNRATKRIHSKNPYTVATQQDSVVLIPPVPVDSEGAFLVFNHLGNDSVELDLGWRQTGVIQSMEKRLQGQMGGVDISIAGATRSKNGAIWIRGTGSSSSGSPLYIVNGSPADEGSLAFVSPERIASIEVLKDLEAIARYGPQAANGVILIQTNDFNPAVQHPEADMSLDMETGNALRRNFHDDAFWQPRLTTNEQGKASFEVTYPDDVTSWNASFVAVGKKNQRDRKQLTIRSFKPLTARLSTPRFVLRGDSLNAVGRIANYLGDSLSVARKISTPAQVFTDELFVRSSLVEQIPTRVEQGDSITIAYSLQTASGYFDGEERSVPILEQGMLQTHGDFKVLNDSLTHTLSVDPDLGSVSIHAETSSIDLFLREIDRVDRYPYLCNEQVASKIKALLAKKRIAKLLGKEFNDDKKIDQLIGHLKKNRNREGLWGWWNKDASEFWISRQVMTALFEAEEAGYKIGLNVSQLGRGFVRGLEINISGLSNPIPGRRYFGKEELLDRLLLLKSLNIPLGYEAYFRQINQLESRTLNEKLKTAFAQASIGLEKEIPVDSLMRYAHETLLGSLYWSDTKEENSFLPSFMLPYQNEVENTRMAYLILKKAGGQEAVLEKIRRYFFERRQNGSWANTYESAQMIETILPDMLQPGEKFRPTTLYINDRPVSAFPFTDKVDVQGSISVRKEGTAPLFVTAYQQDWHKDPEPEDSKGFTVRSYFTMNKDTVSILTAGKAAKLEVLLTVQADAEYTQIEVPIPAGCTYETKGPGDFRKEVHREYFKEKIVVFCKKLSKGEHRFAIDLLPRYSGLYTLNPAKAELMYFPTFYGNEKRRELRTKN